MSPSPLLGSSQNFWHRLMKSWRRGAFDDLGGFGAAFGHGLSRGLFADGNDNLVDADLKLVAGDLAHGLRIVGPNFVITNGDAAAHRRVHDFEL